MFGLAITHQLYKGRSDDAIFLVFSFLPHYLADHHDGGQYDLVLSTWLPDSSPIAHTR